MRYDISLALTYDYDPPARAGRHLLHMMPPSLDGLQRVLAASVDIAPRPQERTDRSDFFGNPVTDLAYRGSHERIAFRLRARIDRIAAAPLEDRSPALGRLAGETAAIRSIGPDAPAHFLAASPNVRPSRSFADYALSSIAGAGSSLSAVRALGAAIHADMTYDPDATEVDTPAEDAFRLRRGVCQDFSHIMIACLRSVGIPAGYVSGFLRTIPPPGKSRLEGADAMHAWVRAWCGEAMGWVEFDPTNDIWAAQDHIVVARGRDYSDVAPVSGVLRAAGAQTGKQAVDVIPLD